MNSIYERLQYCILFCKFCYNIVNMYVFIHYVVACLTCKSIYFSSIVNSRSNPFLGLTSAKQWGLGTLLKEIAGAFDGVRSHNWPITLPFNNNCCYHYTCDIVVISIKQLAIVIKCMLFN